MRNAFAIGGFIDAADGSGHRVYYEAHGPVNAPAFVMVHGNAGYLFDLKKISMWDLKKQRVVIIHARGVGASRPAGKTEHNQYKNLADDIETIRQKLKLGNITLFGWSGGAGVSLVYADKYPQHCRGAVLYGAFLGRQKELQNYYTRSRKKYPEGWSKFCKHYGVGDPLAAVRRCNLEILHGEPNLKRQAVLRYERIFGAVKISPLDLDQLVLNRMVYANMIENDFGLTGQDIKIRKNTLFIRGQDDYIGTHRAGEMIIKNAGHDVHDPHVQSFLKRIIAGLTPPLSSSLRQQPPQP
ncbi:MAG: alpha/beta fold hydrolase [Micavibrio sp.]